MADEPTINLGAGVELDFPASGPVSPWVKQAQEAAQAEMEAKRRRALGHPVVRAAAPPLPPPPPANETEEYSLIR